MIYDTFQWEVLHDIKVNRYNELLTFWFSFYHFGSMFRDKHPIWVNAVKWIQRNFYYGHFPFQFRADDITQHLPYEEEICKHNSRDYTHFTSQRMRSNMQFNTVSASVLNILNQVTSDRIFILPLLTYQKQLILFLLHRVVFSNSLPINPQLLWKEYSTIYECRKGRTNYYISI